MCLQPQRPQLYIGEREGALSPLGFPPQGVRQPQNPSRVATKGGERGVHLGWALGPICPRVCPFPSWRHLGPWWEVPQPT